MPQEAASTAAPPHDPHFLAASARVPQHVVYRAFPAETVVLNLNTGIYHGLNPVAGRMLRALEGSTRIADAVRELKEEFPAAADRVEADVRRLCGELLERGLIELSPPNGR